MAILTPLFQMDRVFIIHFWSELFRITGNPLMYSSAYHPQTDGQTEFIERSHRPSIYAILQHPTKKVAQMASLGRILFNTTF